MILVDSAGDGTFAACDLTPGDYSLLVAAPAPVFGKQRFAISDSDVRDLVLSVKPASLHLQLAWDGDPPAGRGPGSPTKDQPGSDWLRSELDSSQMSILEGDTAPVEGSAIAVRIADFVEEQSAPYEGPFGPKFGPGDYYVEVRRAPGAYVKQMSFDGVAIRDRTLHLAAGSSGTLAIVASQHGGRLTGVVTDAEGNPLPGTTVLLMPEGFADAATFARLAQREKSDANGSFTWMALAPGID
jgi:hypothetical protein